MASDDPAGMSFEDRARRAVGLPTAAEVAAQPAAVERARKAREDDEPRRQALISEFISKVGLMIDRVCNHTNAAILEAGLVLHEVTVHQREHLAEKRYVLRLKNKPGTLNLRVAMQQPVSPMIFHLKADGTLEASSPDIVTVPPTLRTGLPSKSGQLRDFSEETVEEFVLGYIKAATMALKAEPT